MSSVRMILCVVLLGVSSLFAADPPKRIYVNRYDPAEHPDRGRFAVTPPDRKTFGDEVLFMTCRGIRTVRDKETGRTRGVDFDEMYRPYAEADLGTIIWPHHSTIHIDNLDEFAEWAKKNGIFVFDLWGYVPGSGPYGRGTWVQNRPAKKSFETLEKILGPQWLGMDNGEQDGRYIGFYASRMTPVTRCRFDQYLNFQRHFERLGDDLGNRLATLVSLNFGHYFLKEGIYTLIGAETAQALPNSQVYYSWIRGAGKQYGVLWFGNASIYNRWGFKSYPNQIDQGTSLSLMKRLLYSHILYNSAAVGFENGWFSEGELTPIGEIQRDAARWVKEHGDPGTMITPVALLCDFFCGWSFPRHLYSPRSYRVWGNIPYGPGDYLNNNLLGLIYPDYQSSSYFYNERGFLSATPYGDATDSLLTDAPLWILNRYPLLIVADRLTGGDPRRNLEGRPTSRNPELIRKLTDYVEGGGRLVFTAGNLEALDGFLGMRILGSDRFEAGAEILFADGNESVRESQPFTLISVSVPEDARVLASCEGKTAAFEVSHGKGTVLVLNTPFGISGERAVEGYLPIRVDQVLENPYPLLAHAEKIYRRELDQTVLFDVGQDLGSIVCRKADRVWTVGVFNHGLLELPFAIRSRIGEIASIREIPVPDTERTRPGFMPVGYDHFDRGRHTDTTIAVGEVRVFEVTLKEEKTAMIDDLPIPPAPKGRFLQLRHPVMAKEEILARPTFFEHYDGITLDWRYFDLRSEEAVAREAGWFRRHGLHLAVDFSSGINLFPDLRLSNNDEEEYERAMATMKAVLKKGALLGVDTVLFSTHTSPENNSTPEITYANTVETLRELTNLAADLGMKSFLRVDLNQPLADLELGKKYLDDIAVPSLKLAPQISLLVDRPDQAETMKDEIGIILASGTLFDEGNSLNWTTNLPLDEGENAEAYRRFLDTHPEIPRIEQDEL